MKQTSRITNAAARRFVIAAASLVSICLLPCLAVRAEADEPQGAHPPKSNQVYLCDGRWTNTPCDGSAPITSNRFSTVHAEDYRAEKVDIADKKDGPSKQADADKPDAPGKKDAATKPDGAENKEEHPKEAKSSDFDLTRLRVTEKLAWTADSKGLTSATVTLRNVGDMQAKDIKVNVVVSNDSAGHIKLDGPAVLEPNKVGNYKLAKSADAAIKSPPKVEALCANCRK